MDDVVDRLRMGIALQEETRHGSLVERVFVFVGLTEKSIGADELAESFIYNR